MEGQLKPAECQIRKTSTKRCLSPGDALHEHGGQASKRKVTNPMLMLVQAGLDTKDVSLGHLDHQYRLMVDRDKEIQASKAISRQDSDLTPTFNDDATDTCQSSDSLPSCIDFSISASSRSFSLSHKPSSFSSSYPSFTEPLAGHRLSDSRVPNSSILDSGPADSANVLPTSFDRPMKRSKKSFKKRDSFDDTSKDISDMEDWDVDDIDDINEDKIDINKLSEMKKENTVEDKDMHKNLSYHPKRSICRKQNHSKKHSF